MISSILLLCQMLMITGLTINLSEQCTCEHYSQEMCNFYSFCSWNNDKCGNIVCANKPKDMCTADYTDFKCEYDNVENVCKEKKYTCNDLGANYCRFSKILGMNCIWSINDKCEDFDCTIAKNCPFKYCAFSNNKCSNPTTKIDCTALTYSQCQLSSDGFGNFCLANEDKVCKSYDAQIECSQWNDQPLLSCFTIGCQVEDFKCRDKKCSDFYTQNSCTYIYEDDSNSITVCKWTGRNCVEATSQDIEAFTKYDCVVNSVLTYEWENEKCQKCVNPVSTEVTNNTSNQNNNQSSSSSTESNSSSTTSSSNTTSNTSNTQPSTNENTNQTPTNNQTSNNQSNSQSSTNETPTESSTTNNEGTSGENNNQTPITNETETNSNEETSNQINQENSNQNNTLNTNSTIPDNQNTTQSNNTSSSQNSTNTQNTTVTTVINQVQNNGTNQTQIFSNLTQQIKAQIGANNLLEISVQMFDHLLWITIALIYLS